MLMAADWLSNTLKYEIYESSELVMIYQIPHVYVTLNTASGPAVTSEENGRRVKIRQCY